MSDPNRPHVIQYNHGHGIDAGPERSFVTVRITRAKFEWKVEDLWVGVFWKHGDITTDEGQKRMWTDVWICLLPCVPLHLTITYDVTIPFES